MRIHKRRIGTEKKKPKEEEANWLLLREGNQEKGGRRDRKEAKKKERPIDVENFGCRRKVATDHRMMDSRRNYLLAIR